jgi:inner membrane protein YidH
MIERYSDHAANERTFLAWVRTAIAVMAFGFLVEKFDLFLEIAAKSADVRAPAGGQLLANIAGLALIALGGATMVLAIVRFRRTSLAIDSDERRPGTGEQMDIALGALLAVLGAALFVYLCYTAFSRF